MAIDALPEPPSSSDPSNFQTEADAFLGALPTFRSQANTLAAGMTAIAAGTALAIPYTFSSTTTDSDPGAGTLRLDNATQNAATTIRADLTDAAGADVTNILALFDDSTSTIKGDITLQKLNDATKFITFSATALASPSGYRNITGSVVTASAASPFTNGDSLVLKFTRNGDKGDTGATGNSAIAYDERTSNTQITNADSGKHINVTGASTFTQTFAAISGISANFFVIYENSGTGEVTLDPDGAEQIDGRTTFIVYPGEKRKIQRNEAGTAWSSTVLHPFHQAYTANGTLTTPPGYYYFGGLLWGGGASGAKSGPGGGGGGGACVEFLLPASAFGTTETITIGAAVTGPSSNGNGVAGNNSTLGSLVTAYGGAAGATSKAGGGGGGALSAGSGTSGGGPGGGATGADSAFGGGGGGNTTGNAGGRSYYGGGGGGADGAAGGASVYGGGGGGGSGAAGGTSTAGGSGGAGSAASSGTNGTAPGGGGGGTSTGAKAGDGARGELRIWGIA